MKIARKILKWVLYILLVPITFLVVAFILTSITVDREVEDEALASSTHLSSNGVHLTIFMPKNELDVAITKHKQLKKGDDSIRWGRRSLE